MRATTRASLGGAVIAATLGRTAAPAIAAYTTKAEAATPRIAGQGAGLRVLSTVWSSIGR
jgi:hypothetical protein